MSSQLRTHRKRPPGSNGQLQTHSHTGDPVEWVSKSKMKLDRIQSTSVSGMLNYRWAICITHLSHVKPHGNFRKVKAERLEEPELREG